MQYRYLLNYLITIISITIMLVSFQATAATAPEKKPNNANITTTSSVTIYGEDKPNIQVLSDQPSFTIKLKSNPTTGYSWFLREYDSNLLTPVKHSFQPPDSQLIGASGYELWTFKVKPSGFTVPQQTNIRLIYTRPWQSDNATQLVFRVTIQKVEK